MITMTSAAANKLLKTLDDERAYLRSQEQERYTYTLTEDEKTPPPDYDYEEISAKMEEIDRKICTIKHAINLFNTTTKLNGLDLTIDTALVRLAQLNRNKYRLDSMRKKQPVTRSSVGFTRSALVEYTYVNYDIEKTLQDYEKVSEEIYQLQMAIDLCNQTIPFEIDI